MSKKFPLTQEQLNDLKKEKEKLLTFDIPVNSEEIERAKAQGDLSENAEYDEAKDKQAKLHARLSIIEHRIANAQIIQENKDNSKVAIGHSVTIKSLNNNEEIIETIKILGYGNGKETISADSPLGKALLGKKKNERVNVEAPIGRLTYQILKIN